VTAGVGAQLTFLGLGAMTGHYPRVTDVPEWVPWVYVACIICMFVGGVLFQCCYYRNHHEKNKHYSHRTQTKQEVVITI